MEALFAILISLLTLTALEIVLGIDNLIFISIMSNRLPAEQRSRARRTGLALAVITRLLLLASIAWLAGVTTPLFTAFDHPVSLRDLVLLGGGLFLLAKGTTEIHATVDGVEQELRDLKPASFASVIVQIIILDIVFSLDSVITAVGMAQQLSVMATAIIIAVIIMLFAADPISRFIHENLSIKMLALSFLILVGAFLVADGLGFHVPKAYLYFAIAFSVGVETLNLTTTKRRRRQQMLEADPPGLEPEGGAQDAARELEQRSGPSEEHGAGVEIEHKFLLRDERWRRQVERSIRIRQGYLVSDAQRSVRVRVADDQGFLNVKSGTLGVQRSEYEYAIPLAEAERLLDTLCERPLLEKTRHHVRVGAHLWEIDEFAGDNAGLIVAEVELSRPDEPFERPDWAGEDVSHDERYYNSQLARYPYQTWL